MNTEDTIAAIASAPGGALRGIIRISGNDTLACLERCLVSPSSTHHGRIAHPTASENSLAVGPPVGNLRCTVYVWPGRRSYTREPAAELHLPGSPPLLELAMKRLGRAGVRPAQPGEFTLRAFLAGRLDLTQAEAVLGVIDAHSQQQLDFALTQLAGGLAQPLGQLRERLLDLLAQLEAGLDFVEEDIEFVTTGQVLEQLTEAETEIQAVSDRLNARRVADDQFRIVLRGWPNVGKSSLMNALVGQDAALVANTAGTTRDYVSHTVTIQGLVCRLIDTAGVENKSHDGISDAAQRLGGEQVDHADIELFCIDATRHLNVWEKQILEPPSSSESRLLVLTKTDGPITTDLHLPAIRTSAVTTHGLEQLRSAVYQKIFASLERQDIAAPTAVRCAESVREASTAIGRARRATTTSAGDEIVAAEIRLALEALGTIVGAVYTDDILDRVFSRFCIGK